MKAEEDIRHIENPFNKILHIIKPDHDKLFNMLFNLIQELLDHVELPSLLAVASVSNETEVDISAYAGANGYLYTLIRLHRYICLQLGFLNFNR